MSGASALSLPSLVFVPGTICGLGGPDPDALGVCGIQHTWICFVYFFAWACIRVCARVWVWVWVCVCVLFTDNITLFSHLTLVSVCVCPYSLHQYRHFLYHEPSHLSLPLISSSYFSTITYLLPSSPVLRCTLMPHQILTTTSTFRTQSSWKNSTPTPWPPW